MGYALVQQKNDWIKGTKMSVDGNTHNTDDSLAGGNYLKYHMWKCW
jgi:hypothetical protein